MSNVKMIATPAAANLPGETAAIAGVVAGIPRSLLRFEGGAVLIAATALYAHQGWSWWLFGILFLAPDLFMLGYLAGPRTGAAVYNVGHTYLAPGILAAVGVLAGNGLAPAIATIWVGHIGFDRLLGYGLKYPAAFQHTHLGAPGLR